MFTSGTQATQGRKVNHDPLPVRGPKGRRYTDDGYGALREDDLFFDPRPKYDVLDNPILAAFRKRESAQNPYALHQWHAFLLHGWDGSICAATPAQTKHAHRVIDLLLALGSTR